MQAGSSPSRASRISFSDRARDTRGLVLHLTSLRPYRTIAVGGYLFRATLAGSWRTQQPLTTDGAMLVMQSARGEFYVVGNELNVSFLRDPDVDSSVAGIASIEQLAWKDGRWIVEAQLNGDQSHQGRQLLMDIHSFHVYRLRLYSYPPR